MSSVTSLNSLSDRQGALSWLWLSALVIVLDLGTKFWASSVLFYNRPVEILPVFDLRLLHNTGAAFSFLASADGWQRWLFAVIALVVSGFILRWLRETPKTARVLAGAYSLILGGALGNLFDRIVHGYVVDFISLHYAGWYFPAFNIADMAITCGAALLIFDMLFLAKKRETNN